MGVQCATPWLPSTFCFDGIIDKSFLYVIAFTINVVATVSFDDFAALYVSFIYDMIWWARMEYRETIQAGVFQ